ncbi:MAG: hypothetical protein ACLQLC_03470 [Candidatus Sulfotelmatobacter sp.]
MKQSKPIWIAALAAIALLVLLSPVPAHAQSCALCYTQAASSGQRMIQALKSGILVLVVPPTLGSIGLVFVVYRKRNQTRDESEFPGDEAEGHDANQDW